MGIVGPVLPADDSASSPLLHRILSAAFASFHHLQLQRVKYSLIDDFYMGKKLSLSVRLLRL